MLSVSFYSRGWLRVFSVAVVVFFSVHSASGQAVEFCGVLPFNEAESTNPDSVLFDRFGNSYDLVDYRTPQYRKAFTETGYFHLNYEFPVSEDMKAVIDRVFLNVAEIVPQRISTTSCGENVIPGKVIIRIQELTGGSPGVLAAVSPMYGPDYQGATCNHVVPNNAQHRINGGSKLIDWDAILQIRTTLPLGTSWNTSYPDPTGPDYYDLYSVVLHEALHILGFASNLGLEGLPVYEQPFNNLDDNIYSVWDDLLFVTDEYIPNGLSGNVEKVLEGSCTSHCKSLHSVLFPTGGDFDEAVEGNCSTGGGLDFMIGEHGIAPVLGGGPFADKVEMVNALSHLSPDCNGQSEDYVMQLSISDGVDRREITVAEMEILCELGYAVEGCNKCYISAIGIPNDPDYFVPSVRGNDETTCCPRNHYVCRGETLSISFEDLLCDKFTNSPTVEIIDAYHMVGSPFDPETYERGDRVEIEGEYVVVSPDETITSNIIYVVYEVKVCDCEIVRFVAIVHTGECIECEEGDICGNLVCTEGFEEFQDINSVSYINFFEETGGGYHIYEGNNSNFFYFCNYNDGVGDNTYVRFTNSGSTFTPSKNGLSFKLTNPIQPGCTAKVKFKASTIQGTTHFEFLGSETPPCYFLDSRVKHGCQPTDCGDYIYNPVCMENMPILRTSPPYATGNCSATPGFTEYDFDWKNEEDFPVHYIMVSVNPSNPIQYHVYFDDLEVLNECPVDACFDYETDCLTVSFGSCYEEGYEHEWIFDDGNTSSEANPVHTYVTAGTYYVQHHILNECDNATDSETLEVVVEECEDCECTEVGSININAGAGTYISNYPSSGFSDRCISIRGTLIIDKTFTITGGEIIMNSGAEIKIVDNGRLWLRNINNNGGIHGCDNMWKGITVEEGGNLILTTSTISDAHHAVKLLENSTHHIQGSTFSRNYIGVHVPVQLTPNSMVNINQAMPLIGNTFDCPGVDCILLPPYEGQPALSSNKPYAGIDINGTTFMIGLSYAGSVVPNKFYEVANGIMSGNSSIASFRSVFETFYPGQLFGTNHKSIVSTRSKMRVEDNYMKLRTSAFESQTDLGTRFINSEIDNCWEGVLYRNTGFAPYDYLSGNDITFKLRGVSSSNHRKPLIGSENNFYPSESIATLGLGVSLNHTLSSITNNEFHLNNNCIGIEVNNSSRVLLSNNDLINPEFPSTNLSVAINLSNSRNCIASKNMISEKGIAPNSHSTGISLRNSTLNLICCNEIESQISLRIQQSSPDTKFRNNELLGYTYVGLKVDISALMGRQINTGNTWMNTAMAPFDAVNDNISNFNYRIGSQFEVNECPSDLWPVDINPAQDNCSINENDWFFFDEEGVINTDCSDCPSVYNFAEMADDIGLNDLAYLQGLYQDTYWSNMINWEMGKQLYRKIYKDTALINYSSEVTDFYNAKKIVSMGKLVELEEAIAELNYTPRADRDTIEMIDGAIEIKMDSIRTLDSLLYFATTYLDSMNFSTTRMGTINNINPLMSQLHEKYSSLRVIRLNKADSLITANNAIYTTHVIDFMEKYLNSVFLETVARDTFAFSGSQKVNLYNIAKECPNEFGGVVYRARALYDLIEVREYDDSACDISLPELYLKEEDNNSIISPKEDLKLVMRPNPAKDWIDLEWSIEDSNEGDLAFELINMQGGILWTGKALAQDRKLQIDLSRQLPGIYILRVMQDGKLLEIKKVMVLK